MIFQKAANTFSLGTVVAGTARKWCIFAKTIYFDFVIAGQINVYYTFVPDVSSLAAGFTMPYDVKYAPALVYGLVASVLDVERDPGAVVFWTRYDAAKATAAAIQASLLGEL